MNQSPTTPPKLPRLAQQQPADLSIHDRAITNHLTQLVQRVALVMLEGLQLRQGHAVLSAESGALARVSGRLRQRGGSVKR